MKKLLSISILAAFAAQASTSEANTPADTLLLECTVAPEECVFKIDEFIGSSSLSGDQLDIELSLLAAQLADQFPRPEKHGKAWRKAKHLGAAYELALGRIAKHFEDRGRTELAQRIQGLIVEVERRSALAPSAN
ncbi:hypothetical protein [Silicimonas sp. MF1-12-2]|uniref:hypothetical protein n=1 Tax=Silicimonas sp. MF1-12-2 TaxID=3384793 RepID=UPI0039B40D51